MGLDVIVFFDWEVVVVYDGWVGYDVGGLDDDICWDDFVGGEFDVVVDGFCDLGVEVDECVLFVEVFYDLFVGF